MNQISEKIVVNTKKISCDGSEISKHPKVYLALKKEMDEAKCPYCSKIYIYKTKP